MIEDVQQTPAAKPPLPAISSQDLMGTARELIIRHNDGQYRLCLTSNNKLILVK